MKKKIKNLVEDQNQGLYFHQDAKNKYQIDESKIPHGYIYGLKNRTKDGKDKNKRVNSN